MKKVIYFLSIIFSLASCNLQDELPQRVDLSSDWVGNYAANYKAIINDGSAVDSTVSMTIKMEKLTAYSLKGTMTLKAGTSVIPTVFNNLQLSDANDCVINETVSNAYATSKATGKITRSGNNLLLDAKFEYGTNGVQLLKVNFTKQ